jgi:hypothetical protein
MKSLRVTLVVLASTGWSVIAQPLSYVISDELEKIRRELEAIRLQNAGPSTKQLENEARRAWVAPKFGLGGELLNASEIPPQFRAKVAASMGKPVEQVFAKQLAAERGPHGDSADKVRVLEARIAELEAKQRQQGATRR